MERREKKRSFTIWHWSWGKVRLNPGRDPDRCFYYLQELTQDGLWNEVRKFPVYFIVRWLKKTSHLDPTTREFLHLYAQTHRP